MKKTGSSPLPVRPKARVLHFRGYAWLRKSPSAPAGILLLIFICAVIALCFPGRHSLGSAGSDEGDNREPSVRSELSKRLATPDPLVTYSYRLLHSYPHDPEAFTQGLVYADGFFYEGTGGYGTSTIRKVHQPTGTVIQQHRLSDQYFGEGITLFGNDLIQLTWRSRQGFVYDKETFAVKRVFSYPTEGWGITTDGDRLIMSDGTATLHFLDPRTFTVIGHLAVSDSNGPVTMLNELEYVRDALYANIWGTTRIAVISLFTGRVLGWIDLQGLANAVQKEGTVDVLNGIAFDPEGRRLFVTGKLWPRVFEIELVPPFDSPPATLPIPHD